ncbi:unnamed protein product [Orchesella dallaii]|uniref:Protein kinase domain-containing protein n=1 Tax=Orchesella dallaii TaxID=48710 RepID=A0ABP1RIB2_9HEXA
MKRNLEAVAILLTISSFSYFLKSDVVDNIQFDRNFTGVVFIHGVSFLKADYNAYSALEIEAMLDVISNRFAHVIVFPAFRKTLNGSSLMQSSIDAPVAAAKLNKKSKFSQTGFLPFDIKIAISLNAASDWRTVRDKVDLALKLVSETNSIYSGTVSTLLLDTSDIKKEQTKNTSIQIISHIRNHTLGHELKVGLWINNVHCGSSGMVYAYSYTLEVLKHVDLVVFWHAPTTSQIAEGLKADVASQIVIDAFSTCRKRLRLSFPDNLTIIWSTESSTFKADGYYLNFFVTYWKLMADWAAKHEQFLFFTEAFDQSGKENFYTNRGWWRLKRKDTLYITTSSFVEKIKDQIKPQDKIELKPEDSLSVTTILLIVLGVCLVFFVLFGGGLYILYRYVKNLLTQRLSREDYKEFMEGSSIAGRNEEVGGNCLEILRLPYDSQQYELSKNSFTIDYTALLGTGTFGFVYKGKIHEQNKDFAFKLTKPSCSTTTLKGLLSEIKLLSYLGNHENIVSLIGSYTVELKKGIVYVVTELCERGSLEKFMRSQQQNYYNQMKELSGSNNDDDKIVNKTFQCNGDMLRWSIEIASGLEYIASKNVVHADIATRNILLTSNLTAKISDFGLSRRMYDYTNYVKKQQEPLPWRWMSIEALKNLEFSEKSDVWAFGVTMWEIFSLGDKPYPGLSWNLDFVGELQRGLRLQRPTYSTEEIYQVMRECWHPNPVNRWSFSVVKSILMNLDSCE